MEFNMLIRDLMRDLVKQVGSGMSFQVTNIRPKLSNNEEYLQEMDRVLAAEAKTLRLTDFKLDHVFANTAAGSDNKENVGSPESMLLGLEFNDLSIIKNECEEEGDPTIMREGNVWSPEMPNSGSSPSASNVDGSNPNNIMGWNMLSPVGDLVEIYETDEKETGESKAILEPASSADKEMVDEDAEKLWIIMVFSRLQRGKVHCSATRKMKFILNSPIQTNTKS
ncbi:hypothetical protein D5086_014287 [Populus alba]|uniref:Uncharacterized protein n=1 Tax=Populus alba TaxID=43335 RepID=A0ACC4BXT5_POPAL